MEHYAVNDIRGTESSGKDTRSKGDRVICYIFKEERAMETRCRRTLIDL
jgi:hypothetical protein